MTRSKSLNNKNNLYKNKQNNLKKKWIPKMP